METVEGQQIMGTNNIIKIVIIKISIMEKISHFVISKTQLVVSPRINSTDIYKVIEVISKGTRTISDSMGTRIITKEMIFANMDNNFNKIAHILDRAVGETDLILLHILNQT